jgi:hypothetical protein
VKYRALVALPFLALVAFIAALALAGASGRATVVRIDVEFAKTIAFVGCTAAALRFARGDYLRLAWALNAACYFLILVLEVGLRPGGGLVAGAAWAPTARGIIVVIANACQLGGTVMLARTWRVAGFELAGSPAVRIAVQIGAIAIALASGAWLTWTGFLQVIHGDTGALVDFGSTLADIISFALIAPFLLTAIAFRGGSLGWTWGLYTTSLMGWLLFDATVSYVPFFASADTTTVISECCRLLACAFGGSAGFAQRFAVAGVRAPSAVTAEQPAA